MSVDLEEFKKDLFKASQRPIAWLLSAERLQGAAEAILEHERRYEVEYFKAYAQAQQEAVAQAYSDGNTSGVVEIKATPPNYPPAQLLYAFAIENLLKGLLVAGKPELVEGEELSSELITHDLLKLAEKGSFRVHVEETPIMKALSQLSVWAARYPVARTRREHTGAPNSDELLDYGSAHPVMRRLYERATES